MAPHPGKSSSPPASPTVDISASTMRSTADNLSKRRSIVIVFLLVLLIEVFSFEFIMIAPALPNIAAHFGVTSVSVVYAIGLLVGAVVVPVFAKLGDRYGKKKVLLSASGAVAVGALICIVAPTFEILLLGRAVQGIGMIGSVITYGLIRDLLPAQCVPLGIGGIGVGFGVAGLLGPLLGGWLIDNSGWQAAFWFLFVYVIITGLLVAVFVPETDVRARHKVDYRGALILGVGVGLLMYAATFENYRIAAAVVGLTALISFYFIERRTAEPLISFRLLVYPPVWTTLAVCALLGAAIAAGNGILPQMLRATSSPGSAMPGLGLTAMEYALYLGIPIGVSGACTGIAAGWCSRRWGPRLPLLASGTFWLAACALLAGGIATSVSAVMTVGLLLGMGQGCYYASSGNMLIEAVPATSQGIGASMKFQAEQLSGSLSLAVFGLILASSVQGIDPQTSMVQYDMDGFKIVFFILALVCVAGVAGVLRMKHGRTPASGGTLSDRPEVVDLENTH
ncbi:MFS transporter [Rhodococcus sp. NPDC019627]|uniref:MFS transporter n=1 Tax=unclassified Rhodococcus (in: high G+C Gram-positive bacteria) TaxID=192944 RepID=UPI0033EDAB24